MLPLLGYKLSQKILVLASRSYYSIHLSLLLDLAALGGNIWKSPKSKLQNALEEKRSLVESVPANAVRIYDEMCIIQ